HPQVFALVVHARAATAPGGVSPPHDVAIRVEDVHARAAATAAASEAATKAATSVAEARAGDDKAELASVPVRRVHDRHGVRCRVGLDRVVVADARTAVDLDAVDVLTTSLHS